MQDFPWGWGAQLSFFWKRHVASSVAVSRCLRGLGACSHKNIFMNGAISCVLRAIFNHFHDKKSSQKIINKQEFFHWPFYNVGPPSIYLNIDVMDT